MSVADRVAAPASGIAGLSQAIDMLDSWGFTIGTTRISVWTALVALAIIVALFLFARYASHYAARLIGQITSIDVARRSLAEKVVSIAIWAMTFFIGLDLLGINLTALTVFSGAFGLAVGFGLQKTFGNLIAGIILLMDRSIKPGDVIAVNDGTNSVVGQVTRIGVRAVSVVTRDKKEFLIPNENLMINQVENWSYSSRDVRIQIPVGIAYNSDIELAERLMLEATSATKRIRKRPAPTVWLSGFGESSVDFLIQCWIDDPEEGLGNVRSEVLKRLWHLFRENGIELPFPQRDLHIKDWPALPPRDS